MHRISKMKKKETSFFKILYPLASFVPKHPCISFCLSDRRSRYDLSFHGWARDVKTGDQVFERAEFFGNDFWPFNWVSLLARLWKKKLTRIER